MTLPRTILVRLDPFIHSRDELFMNLIESDCNIPCQLGTYYIRVVCVVHIQ
jgi:hypothetical protein